MALAFVPIYIQYLGIESYGLVGVFAILQASLGLFDLGMRPAVAREMARFTAGSSGEQYIWDLLRSCEFIIGALALLFASMNWMASGWLASEWIDTQTLPHQSVSWSLALMGLATSAQFVESLYSSTLAGLQKQVAQNAISSTVATMKGVGAIAILEWVAPTAMAFFVWQSICAITGLGLSAMAVYRYLPPPPAAPRFSITCLRSVWRFATGLFVITLLALLLTQVDKILLSRLLTLDLFGYYTLAGAAAGSLTLIVSPVAAAYYPRFNQLVALGDSNGLRTAYHRSSQLVSVMVGSVAATLVLMTQPILTAWTGDVELAKQVAPTLSVLGLGTLIHCLMWIPYQLQLAHGWTSLAIATNAIAVVLLVPALLVVVPTHGMTGAAWLWVLLNAGYLVFGVRLMHRRLLRSERWTWYLKDIGVPLSAAFLATGMSSLILPTREGRVELILTLTATLLVSLGVSAAAAPETRRIGARWVVRARIAISDFA
jgi:O-antigen/teichoic acid export membrane protein